MSEGDGTETVIRVIFNDKTKRTLSELLYMSYNRKIKQSLGQINGNNIDAQMAKQNEIRNLLNDYKHKFELLKIIKGI